MRDSDLFRQWQYYNKGMDAESIERSFANHLEYSLSKDKYTATDHDLYYALALTARDRMVERWIHTQQTYYKQDAKRVYYLSAEYLMGRALINNLINLGIYEETRTALAQLNLDLNDLAEQEHDAGLGNGGLGRLAACFLDSLTALRIPAYGYGIRYEYGIFEQQIRDGRQMELPDQWLKHGNPWELRRPERTYVVRFYGETRQKDCGGGQFLTEWVNTQKVVGVAHDTPVDGFANNSVNTLRLWAARAASEFDLRYFHHGDYLKAVEEKNLSENISKVLYPNANIWEGRELRLKQQYFFVSCSIQDIVRRYLVTHDSFFAFPDKVAIQLNDTHPSLAIAELMRILLDEHGLPWDTAWDITNRTCAYTNHTLLAEALERWPVSMLATLLPRHLQIIFEINRRFLREVAVLYPGDHERQRRMSLIQEGHDKQVRMAHLAIVGSHSVNGVSELHTKLLTERVLRDFHDMYPERFNAKTNGVTPRRWLLAANPPLAKLISEKIGETWPTELDRLRELDSFADDAGFRDRFAAIKLENKRALARTTKELTEISVDPESIFDVQIKRIHEYKRQLLNIVHIVASWLRLKHGGGPAELHPRTYFFGGKAAPDFRAAKQTIQLICHVAEMLNRDRTTNDRIKVVFLPNYRVTLAEKIIPAADVSEQISTAGYEASGTGNMKFALNGALTVGTLDGANVEILEEVGEEHIFIFGLTAGEVVERRAGYRPAELIAANPLLSEALELIRSGFFCPEEPEMFHELVNPLYGGDHYMTCADFGDYMRAQDDVNAAYLDRDRWLRSAVVNVARSGKFSSDRTIAEYNRDIWKVEPVLVER